MVALSFSRSVLLPSLLVTALVTPGLTAPALAARGESGAGIQPALHPTSLRCSSLGYCSISAATPRRADFARWGEGLRALPVSVLRHHFHHGLQAQAQPKPRPYEPTVGQGGKDVVWVPTPAALVEKMLDMAKVTEDDLVMDLGSGDGRNIIAAARRGARAIGVEYNPDMVNLSRQLAEEAGVSARATFIEGDMYTADISKATVMALFLLPTNLERLRDTFAALRPGTRMVLNTFAIPEWEADASESIGGDCVSWCTSLLYYVPAKVDGKWKTARGELALTQSYQMVTGTLTTDGKSTPVNGRLRGTEIELTAGSETLRGTVAGDRLEGPLAGTRIATR